MVGKKPKRRRLDRTDWELRIRQYEAGTPIADIAKETGLSSHWVYTKIWRHSKEPASERKRHHKLALLRELIRAEADLIAGNTDAAVKQMRALEMLMKLDSVFKRVVETTEAHTQEPDLDADEFHDAKAELERRLARLRAASSGKSLAELGYAEPSEGAAD